MEFNYERQTVKGVTSSALLKWLAYTELERYHNGDLSTESEQQLEILVKLGNILLEQDGVIWDKE